MGYIKTPKGFISNAPQVQFERCDGKRFFSETASTGSFSQTDNTTAVYGGWGKTPLGFVDGDSTAEITVSDAMFELDMFELGSTGSVNSQTATFEQATIAATSSSNQTRVYVRKLPPPGSYTAPPITFVSLVDLDGLDRVNEQAQVEAGKYYVSSDTHPTSSFYVYFSPDDVAVGTDVTVEYRVHEGEDVSVMSGGYYTIERFVDDSIGWTVNFEILPTSLQINGHILTQAQGLAPASGEYIVDPFDDGKQFIIVSEEDFQVGQTVVATYQRRATWVSVMTVATNSGTSRGSLTLTWPVMSPGNDCTQSSVVGLFHMKIPRVMVTQRPSLDASRGTAAVPQIAFSPIDPHRGDNKWYDLVYEDLIDGMPSTNYSEDPFVWDI